MKRITSFIKLQLCILDPLGRVFGLFGLSMVAPAIVASQTEPNFSMAIVFLATGLACSIIGIASWQVGRNRTKEFKVRHASLMVIIIWFFLPLVGAIPLLTYTGGSLVDAYFEAVSGLTASGATIMADIDNLPPSIKLWRGELTWMGGMGLIVLAVAILPNIGIGGRQMMKSEITGPLKDQDLTPQINETAKGLWLIYAVLTAVCMLAYLLCGMDLLDAVVHSFTTLGLGGFSNHDASFAYFNSPLIESVAIVFMIIAGFNFATHLSSLQAFGSRSRLHPEPTAGRWPVLKKMLRLASRLFTPYRNDNEFKPYLICLAVASVFVVVILLITTDMPPWQAVRSGVFNTVSIATTTGYSNTDFYLQWPLFASFLILLMANFTSCSGSTGGGIKMIRVLTIFNRARVEQVKILHPHAFQQVKVAKTVIPDEIVVSIFFFVLTYVITIFLFTLLLLASQPSLDVVTAFSAAMACVSNTGPGLGDVGPGTTYAIFNPIATSIGALAMLLGRLEFLLFLLLFSRDLWR